MLAPWMGPPYSSNSKWPPSELKVDSCSLQRKQVRTGLVDTTCTTPFVLLEYIKKRSNQWLGDLCESCKGIACQSLWHPQVPGHYHHILEVRWNQQIASFCQKANSTLAFNLYKVYSFKRHIYQQKNSLLLLSPLCYNYPQVNLGDNYVLKTII